MRRNLLYIAPFAALLIAGCFEDPSSPIGTAGDGDTTGDGDGDPSTGDGDGDGDPSTGDGDGDPSTGDGDGDGDPSTGDGDGDGDPGCGEAYVFYDMFEQACDAGKVWTWDGGDNFTFLACGDPPGFEGQGWGRTLDVATGVEGSLEFPAVIELGPWVDVDGSFAGVDFDDIDLSGLCEPRLQMQVACGYAAACDAEFWVQIKDSNLPFGVNVIHELVVNEISDNSASNVDIDLTPYQETLVDVTILIHNPVYHPDDVMVYSRPRIVAKR
jgi:hypothetical protein